MHKCTHINVNLLKIGNQTCYAKINYQKRYAYIYTEHFSACNQHYITHFLPRSLADSLYLWCITLLKAGSVLHVLVFLTKYVWLLEKIHSALNFETSVTKSISNFFDVQRNANALMLCKLVHNNSCALNMCPKCNVLFLKHVINTNYM